MELLGTSPSCASANFTEKRAMKKKEVFLQHKVEVRGPAAKKPYETWQKGAGWP